MEKKRVLDKSKKSNIKCEHCKYYQLVDSGKNYFGYNDSYGCVHAESPKYNRPVNYWNRCKHFDWKA